MKSALAITATTMTASQGEGIYLSDIYAEWLLLMDKMQELGMDYSQILLSALRRRFTNIFSSECAPMLACVWMDPRYQVSLNAEQKQIAKKHLTSLYERITHTTQQASEDESVNHDENANICRLEKLMKSYEIESNAKAKNVEINDILESFDSLDRNPPQTDPVKFWTDKKMSAPQMYTLSRIVFAVPGTQATIERNFSTLNRTLTKFRSGLSDETLERILFMNRNSALFGQNLFDDLYK